MSDIDDLQGLRQDYQRLARENREFRAMLMTLLASVEKADKAELTSVLSDIAIRLTGLMQAAADAPPQNPAPTPEPNSVAAANSVEQDPAESELPPSAPISASEAETEFLDALTSEELALGEDIPSVEAADPPPIKPDPAEAADDEETAELHAILDDIRRAIGMSEDEAVEEPAEAVTE